MYVYLDLETLPSQRSDARTRASARVHPPGNLKKGESIAKWDLEQRPAAEEEEWRKTSFDGGWGELAVIGWAVDDGMVETEVRPSLDYSEAALLESFFTGVRHAMDLTHGRLPTFVGHNLSGFDLRFLWQRAVVLGVRPPFRIPYDAAPWHDTIVDTMQMWAGNRGSVKLTDLCLALSIDVGHEDTIDGSQVWDTYSSGDVAIVERHCRADVERTRAVHRRMMFLD